MINNLDEALDRIKTKTCPPNARRLGKNTPCAEVDNCLDCKSLQRMCNVMTYPAANSLDEMARGVMAILEAEEVNQFHVIGSSLGGYFAQYLVVNYPEQVQSAIFANTFPPNDLIVEQNKVVGFLLLYLPEWLIMNVFSGSIRESVYPSSEYSELVLAYGLEQTNGRMNKRQILGRFYCVVDPFNVPDPDALGIPVMIIESDNNDQVCFLNFAGYFFRCYFVFAFCAAGTP